MAVDIKAVRANIWVHWVRRQVVKREQCRSRVGKIHDARIGARLLRWVECLIGPKVWKCVWVLNRGGDAVNCGRRDGRPSGQVGMHVVHLGEVAVCIDGMVPEAL